MGKNLDQIVSSKTLKRRRRICYGMIAGGLALSILTKDANAYVSAVSMATSIYGAMKISTDSVKYGHISSDYK